MAKMKIRWGGRWVELAGGGSVNVEEIIRQANGYTDKMKDELDQAVDDLTDSLANTDEYIDGAFKDGIITQIEATRIKSYLKSVELAKTQVDSEYQEIYDKSPEERKQALALAKADYDADYQNLVNTILVAIEDGLASDGEGTAVDNAFLAFNNSLAFLKSLLTLSIDDITESKLGPIRERLAIAEATITVQADEIKHRVTQTELTDALSENLTIAEDYVDSQMVTVNETIAGIETNYNELDSYIDGAFKDGIIYDSERRKIESYLKTVESSKINLDNRFTEIYNNVDLLDPHKTNLLNAKESYDTVESQLVDLINTVIFDGLASLEEAQQVENKFTEYFNALALIEANLEVAVNAIGNEKERRALENAKKYADELKVGVDADIESLSESIESTEIYLDGAFRDSVLSESEAKTLDTLLKTLSDSKSKADASYAEIHANPDLTAIPKLNLEMKKTAADNKYNALVSAINTAIADPNITEEERSAIDTGFFEYQVAISDLTRAFDIAINEIANEKARKAEESAKGYADDRLTNFVEATVYSQDIEALQAQIDKQISSWFYDYEPSLNTLPASDWTTDELKNSHLGDLFFNTNTGISYRFALEGGVYKWIIVRDEGIAQALAEASKAQETADGKMTVFVAQPVPPYNIGDLWDRGGAIYRSAVDKPSSGTFAITDWILVGDVTANNVAKDVQNVGGQPADTVIRRIADAESAIIQQEDLISARVTETVFTEYADRIETRLSNAEMRITDEAIINTVSSTVQNAKTEAINTAKQNTQSAVDSIKVGARNLFIISTAEKGYLDNGVIVPPDESDLTSDYIAVKPSEQYTIQLWIKGGASKRYWMQVAYYDSNKTYVSSSEEFLGPFSTTDQYFRTTITVPSGISFMRVTSSWVDDDMGKIKVESGNKGTDWSPAPEDIYDNINESIDNIKIGGRNLIRYSKGNTIDGWANWSDITPKIITDYGHKWIWVTKSPNSQATGVHTPVFNLKANVTYTCSFTIASRWNSGYNLNYLYLRKNIDNDVETVKDLPSVNMSDPKFVGNISDGLRVWFTFNHTEDITDARLLIAITGLMENAGFIIREIKVEEGNKPTSWTPAPEDVDGDIDSLKNSLSGIETRVKEAELKITDDAIISTVSQTITTTVDNSIKNLEIGGRNLVQLSDKLEGWLSWYTTSSLSADTFADGSAGIKIKMNDYVTNPRMRVVKAFDSSFKTYTSVVGGKTYTLSFIVKGSSDLTRLEFLGFRIDSDNTNEWVDFPSVDLASLPYYDQAEGSRKYTYTFTAPRTARIRMSFGFGLSNTGVTNNSWATFGRIKVEEGTKATDYSTAPEDVMLNLQIGARNYILNSGGSRFSPENIIKWNAASSDVSKEQLDSDWLSLNIIKDPPGTVGLYTIKNPNLTISAGEEYTFSFTAYLDPASPSESIILDYLYFMGDNASTGANSNFAITSLIPEANRILTKTPKRFIWTVQLPFGDAFTQRNNISVLVASTHFLLNDTVHLKQFKLEKGNRATDWSLAPEDINSGFNQVANDLAGKVSSETYDSDLANTANQLDNLSSTLGEKANASDLDALNSRLNEEVISITESYSSAIEQTFNSVRTSIDSVVEIVSTQGVTVTNVETYMDFTENGLSIGKSDSDMKVEIDNTEMRFVDNGAVVAYINGQKYYITNGEITNSLVIGNHKFEKRGNSTIVTWAGDE